MKHINMINGNMNLLNVLEKSLSDDEVESLDALFILQQNSQANWKEFMMKLSNILSQRWNSYESRKAAGIQFCRELRAKEGKNQQMEIEDKWLTMHPDVRHWIKENILLSLGIDSNNMCPATSCVMSIAFIEFPENEWPDLIKILIQNITNCKSVSTLKEVSLQCLSRLCKGLVGDGRRLLTENSNAILKAIWIGMKDSNEQVVLEATKGLKNGIELFVTNFENESERELIMQAVCEVAQFTNPIIKIAAFRCLTTIALIYYEYMDKYMDSQIFAIATEALRKDEKQVRSEVIEFLRELCAIENELKTRKKNYKISEVNIRNTFYTSKVLTQLMPTFMEVLSRCAKSPNNLNNEMDETWESFIAFLRELVSCCQHSNLSKFIIDFGMKNLDKEDWKHRNAAVAALSSVITIESNLMENFLPMFVQMMIEDHHVKVRGSAAYVIAKMCNGGNIKGLTSNQILISALVMGLEDNNEVAIYVCESLGCLALSGVDIPDQLFEEIVEKLVELINRFDGNSRLHMNAACALYYVAGESRKKGHFAIHKIALAIMQHLRSGALDVQSKDSLIYLHLSLENFLKHVTRESIVQICHMILAVLIINNNSSAILNDQVVIVLATLVRELGEKFIKYVEPFLPFLITLLQRDLKSAIDLLNAICIAVGERITPFSEDIIKILITKLGTKCVSLSVKNQILALLSDFAEALGPMFKIYSQSLLDMITSLQLELDEIHVDTPDFMHVQTELHRHVLKVYRNILQCIEGDEKANFVLTQSILRGISCIVHTITEIVESFSDYFDSFVPCCIEELNDVCAIIEPNMMHLMNGKPICKLLDFAMKNSESDEIKDVAAAIASKIKNVKHSNNDNMLSKNFIRRGLEFVFKTFSGESVKL